MVDSVEQPVKEETVRNGKRGWGDGVERERGEERARKAKQKRKEKRRERERKRGSVWALARFSCLAFEGVFRP